jgi:hypothetical protein
MAATIVVRAAVHPFFTLFLGLNQAARWGMGEIFRHRFIIVSVIIGFYLRGLQGACLGLFLTELIVLSIDYLASQQKWTAEVHFQRYFTLIREISTKRKAHALSQSPFGID